MKEILEKNRYKITPARLLILGIFAKSKVPLSAEKIHKKLQKSKHGKNINEATVYRTLTSFATDHILQRVDFRKEAAYFELAEEHHHHITCVKCETVEDFESKEMEKALGGVLRNSLKFISIGDHSLELFGLCKNCS